MSVFRLFNPKDFHISGVDEFLVRVKKEFNIAVLSNVISDILPYVLRELPVDDYFGETCFLLEYDLAVEKFKDKEMKKVFLVEEVVKKYGKENIIAIVGDSTQDLKAAKHLGIPAIWLNMEGYSILRGGEEDFSDQIVKNYDELFEVLIDL